jgi:hypothetical protein
MRRREFFAVIGGAASAIQWLSAAYQAAAGGACCFSQPCSDWSGNWARELSLFIGTFTTLLAIINPFEVLPVYLQLLEGKDAATHHRIAWKSCV